MSKRLMVLLVLAALSGCAGKGTVTTPGAAFTPSSSDMSQDDAAVINMCQQQALQVTYDLVIQAPELFTEQTVVEISRYLYENCIRDNGRGA